MARLSGISDGPAGAAQTLSAMRQLVLDSIREPAQRVRETALQIIPSANWMAQIRAIQHWVQTRIRYVRDPIDSQGGIELVQTPQKTLEYQAGDCDDQSVLTAALLSAIGHPSRFLAMAFNGGPLEHVVTQTKVNNTGQDARDWVTVETIEARPLGWEPPNITARYVRKV